jgi:hypothetical protein
VLRWVISTLGLAALENEVGALASRSARSVSLYGALTAIWIAATAFACAALSLWLSGRIGTIAACAVVGGGFAVTAIVLQIVLARRRGGGFHPAPRRTTIGASQQIGAITSLAAVAAVGWLVARQMMRR